LPQVVYTARLKRRDFDAGFRDHSVVGCVHVVDRARAGFRSLPPANDATWSVGQSIDASGAVLGYSSNATDTPTIWRPSGSTYVGAALPFPPGQAAGAANSIGAGGASGAVPFGSSDSAANAVNNNDYIVGYVKDPTTAQLGAEAAMWIPGDDEWELFNLDNWLNQINPMLGAQWVLEEATGISDNGLVTGSGVFDSTPTAGPAGVPRGFVLDVSSLVPEPASGAIVLLALAPALLGGRRRRNQGGAPRHGGYFAGGGRTGRTRSLSSLYPSSLKWSLSATKSSSRACPSGVSVVS
jgi:hypothetical protein